MSLQYHLPGGVSLVPSIGVGCERTVGVSEYRGGEMLTVIWRNVAGIELLVKKVPCF